MKEWIGNIKHETQSVIPRSKAVVIFIFALIFAMMTVLSLHVFDDGAQNYWSHSANGIQQAKFIDFMPFDIVLFLIFLVLFFSAGVFIARNTHKLKKVALCGKKLHMSNTRFRIAAVTVMLLAWLPYMTVQAPGVVPMDAQTSIANALGDTPLTNHYPIIYTFYLGIFVHLGQALGDMNLGIMLYCLVQCIVMALTLTHLLVWLKSRTVNKIYIVMTLLFFCLCPLFGKMGMAVWKETIWSCALVALTLGLFNMCLDPKKYLNNRRSILFMAFPTLVIIFFRNNGIYIVAITTLMTLVAFRRQALKMSGVLFGVMIASLIVTGPIYKAAGIIDDSMVESMGIPIQQVAYVVNNNEKSLNDRQREYLYRILPQEKWKSDYNSVIVDPIKWDDEFNMDALGGRAQFIKVWAELLPQNPGAYLKAYAMATYGWWKPGAYSQYEYGNHYVLDGETYGLHFLNQSEEQHELAKNALFSFAMFSAGTLLWIILGLTLTVVFINKHYLLIFIPVLAMYLTMLVGTPVAFGFRYVVFVPMIMPILAIAPMLMDRDNRRSE